MHIELWTKKWRHSTKEGGSTKITAFISNGIIFLHEYGEIGQGSNYKGKERIPECLYGFLHLPFKRAYKSFGLIANPTNEGLGYCQEEMFLIP